MKKNNIWNRATAFVLSIALLGGTAQLWMPDELVQASSNNKIEFKEKVWDDEFIYTNSTTVVSGYSVDTRTLMPDYGSEGNGWQYTDPPFSFYREGATGDGTSSNITGTASTRQLTVNHPLVAEGGSPAKDWMSYTVNPKLTVMVSKGYGSFAYNRAVDSGSGLTTVDVETSSTSALSVTSNSSISFKTESGQVEDGGAQSLTFSPVSAATGTWNPLYLGATVTAQNVKDGSFGIVVRSTMTGQEEQYMTLNVKSPMAKIPAGAVFTLNFTFDTLNQMTLIAISPDRTLGAVAEDMRSYLTGESATGKKLPYIKFSNASDTQYAVTGQFQLLNEFYKYNAPMKIDWTLVDPADSEFLDIRPQQGQQQIVAQVKNIPINDKIIKLNAKIGFKAGSAAGPINERNIEIPITLLGSGSRPKVEIVKAFKGTNSSGAQTITERITTVFPNSLDVFNGSVVHVAPQATQDTWPDYMVQANLKFGYSQGRATYAIVSATGSGQVEFRLEGAPNGSILTTTGTRVANNATGNVEQNTQVNFVAKKAGAVSLKIEYFNALGAISPAYNYSIQITDHSPSSDATLKQLDMTAVPDPNATPEQLEAFRSTYIPDGAFPYGFDRETFTYDITVPDVVNEITLKPVYNELSPYQGVNQDVLISVTPSPSGAGIPAVPPGAISEKIELKREATTTIVVRTIAENGSLETYTLRIKRSSKSLDNSLKDIVVTRTDAERTPIVIAPVFNNATFEYSATVPYSVDKVNVKAIAADSWAARPKIESDGPTTNFFARLFENASNKEVMLRYDVTDPINQIINNVTTITVTVSPENSTVAPGIYRIRITRSPPSDNRDLSDFKILRNKEGEEVKFEGKGFDKTQRILYATVPYSTDLLRFELTPDDVLSQEVRVEASAGTNPTQTLKYIKKGSPLIFNFTGLTQSATPDPALNTITYKIWVKAESGYETDPPYILTVTRADPDTDTRLASLTVVNDADSKPVSGFSFIDTKRDYSFSVPYNTEAVVVTPVAKSALSKVYVNGKLISTNLPSQTIKLASGVVTKITVMVVPESGTEAQEAYVLNITRTVPGKEARLMNLVVNGGTDQKPTPFVPATTAYSWTIPEGTKNFTITATAVDPLATITVDGKAAPNGAASEPIVTTQANVTIQVVVTAQDGKTSKTYTIKITDYNFIKKSDNADLASLITDYGQLAPKFNPTVLEYEVYVKPTAMSLGIKPKPASAKATLEVKAGSLKLTKFDEVYTSSLLEDETVFTIKVTSEDGKNEKTYILNVYRNDEEKEGVFKPITPELVDFESSNPIVIDITNSPVVDAQVFNTLKTQYPDKTILFKGNDYTLEMKGEDIDTLIPHTTQFDLSFSFTTPQETEIRNVMYDLSDDNDTIEPVYLYFDHHGTLPAPMLLTVSLGKAYSNETMYWNYYNQERQRIDYYGYVNTNAKGTFSVPIEHFSTFMVTINKIWGSENKSGLDYSSLPWMEDIAIATPTDKINPNTGRGKAVGGGQ